MKKQITESKHLICDNGIKKNNDADCKLNAREKGLAVGSDWIVEANLPGEGVDAWSCILEAEFSLAGVRIK